MRVLLLAAVACCALAQPPRLPRQGPLSGPEGRAARLEGQVLADRNGLPLRRARVVLMPVDSGRAALLAETDDQGKFVLRDVEPGPYQLEARRDGYLTTSVFRQAGVRMPPRFILAARQELTNLTFRMRPWSVIAGRVRFEDGDPAIGVRIDLYRQYHLRGRHGFALVASATTNDRGEYRAHGLPPGAYYVAAAFEGSGVPTGVELQARLDSNGNEIPTPSYTTTFYPGSTKLSDALAVNLREGDDLSGIDIYMRTVERRKLSGRITDGITGQTITTAALTLERLDSSSTGTLPAAIQLKFNRETDFFEIEDVAPGYYQLWVTATHEGRLMATRTVINVTNGDIDNLELVVVPALPWKGIVKLADSSEQYAGETPLRLTLEPRSERGAIISLSVTFGMEFDISLMPLETYDVFLEGLPTKYYLAAVRVGGTDVRAAGLSASLATNLPFEIVLDSRGGIIDGAVTGAGETGIGFGSVAWPGATVELIPDPAANRLQSYRETFADQSGIFHFEGIPPGRYILAAWYDEPACDIFDANALDDCRATGTTVDVTASSRQQVVLEVKPITRR